MRAYPTKLSKLTGTAYGEIEPKARRLYNLERKRTKRIPYVRSTYFKKDKVFLDRFWSHLNEKRRRDRKRRLRYYPCALDLIRHTKIKPISKQNLNKRSEILHRFSGITRQKETFIVQVTEDSRTGRKYFISVFPAGQAK